MNQNVRIETAGEELAQPLGQVLTEVISRQPAVLWCEPTPTRSRVLHRPALWLNPGAETLSQLEGVALDEARVFWPDRQVHLVAETAARTKVARFAWRRAADELPPDGSVHVVEGSVIPVQDLDRFGLSAGETKGVTLQTTRVYRHGRLVFFTLFQA